MKIGILTFHRAENFGAVLQVYALQRFLQEKGHEVQVIDYRNRHIEAMYHIFNPYVLFLRKNIFKSLIAYLSRFRNVGGRKQCKRKYEHFRNEYLKISGRCKNVVDVADLYDCIIAGSDQIWNLHLTGGLDSNYFLAYKKGEGKKKIAYAASSETDPKGLISCHRDEIGRCLDDFDFLSVREESLRDELSACTENEIKVCLDPTFLLKADDYKRMAGSGGYGRYVLVYHMTPIPEGAALAERIAADNGLDIVEIHMGYGGTCDRRHKFNLGPFEILGYIVHADTVITSSFHGLALSLIMKKNVWVIDKGNNTRQRNLLSLLHLDDRFLRSIDGFKDEDIDYSVAGELLERHIAESADFICNALDD